MLQVKQMWQVGQVARVGQVAQLAQVAQVGQANQINFDFGKKFFLFAEAHSVLIYTLNSLHYSNFTNYAFLLRRCVMITNPSCVIHNC